MTAHAQRKANRLEWKGCTCHRYVCDCVDFGKGAAKSAAPGFEPSLFPGVVHVRPAKSVQRGIFDAVGDEVELTRLRGGS